MKTLYRSIFAWFFLLLVVSLGMILLASPNVLLRFSASGGPLDRMNLVFLKQARDQLSTAGPTGLRSYLGSLEAQLPAIYYLVDASGRDLLTGEDRKGLLEKASDNFVVPREQGRFVRAYTNDGMSLIALIRPERSSESRGPFMLLLVAVMGILCWLFARNLASPVRSLALTVERFGRGDIEARSSIRRKDEIGDLARSFNQMADRIALLVRAERRLLQDVSHELQSPLARLAVAAKLTLTATDRDHAAARLQKEIVRLSEMVSGLLDITRAEGDLTSQARDPIDLRALVADVVADCEWEAGEKQCEIQASLCPATISGDAGLLRQAIENVLRNAVYYSPASSKIEVALQLHDGMVSISIRDQGPGVPPDSLERIFVPFYRVETSRDSSRGGTGLGLSLAQRAVLLHQGRIEAENANPGLRVSIHLYTSQ